MIRCFLTTALLLALASRGFADDWPAITTENPGGAYQSLWLTLSGEAWPDAAGEVRVFVGLRDGKGTAAWLCDTVIGKTRIWIDENTVVCDGKKLSGGLQGVFGNYPQDSFSIQFDGGLKGDGLAGTYAGVVGEAKTSGTWTGTLADAVALAKANGIAAGHDWPRYHGATGGMQGPAGGPKLIGDLEQAVPVWKSEEHLPCGWGNAPDRRYGPRPLIASRLAGGTSSPVVNDGVVYQYYYVPAGKGEPVPEWDTTTWDKGWNNPDVIKRLGGGGPFPQIGLDFNAPSADDIIVAMDAATGQTLWKTVAPRRGWNLQTHKWRGMNPAPLVHDGVVYTIGYAGFVMALDANTGKLLWDNDGLHRPQTSTGGFYGSDGKAGVPVAGPLVAGGGLVLCNTGSSWTVPKKLTRTVSLDLKTGEVRWQREQIVGRTQLWQHDGKDYVIVAFDRPNKDNVGGVCLDATTGETAFDLPAEVGATHGFMPLVSGDYLLGCKLEVRGYQASTVGLTCVKLSPRGAERVWSADNRSDGDQWAAALSSTHAYITDPQGLRVFDLASGKQTAEVPQGDGHRTQLPFLAGGRLFIQPEGRHGGQGFKMFDLTDPSQPKPLGAADRQRTSEGLDGETLWRPPHPYTTAYAVHPLGYPVVDGRIFIRGNAGIYCYDLRAE